jgi:hypothetical protein
VLTAQTASFVALAQTASFVALAQSASNAVAAQTASFANEFTVASTLTAQTLVVQTITSSVDFVTGSTRFGSILDNTHIFSGSVTMNPGGLFVSSSGNVGIGTITPTDLLHLYKSGTVYQMIQTVSGGAGTVYRRSNSPTPDWTIGHGAASANENFEVYTAGTGSFVWTMNGADKMRITPTGTIGIGTSSAPVGNLNLWGGTAQYLVLTNTGADGVTSAIQGGIIGQARGYGNNLAQMASILFRNNPTTWYKGEITFNTNDSDGTNPAASTVERMRITSAGNVGIGTSTPSSNLQINGSNATVYDQTVDNGQDDAGVTTTIRNGDTSTVGSFSQINMQVSGDSGRALGRIVTIRMASATSDMAFVTENANEKKEKMRITSGGEVCVNISSPSYTDVGRGNITIGGATSKSAILGMNIGGVPRSYFYSNNTDTFIDNASGTGDVVVLNGTGGVKLTRNATSWVSNSDIRLKNINSTIENAVDKLSTLRTVNFSWKSDETNKENLGLIAQDIEAVFPQIVSKSKLALKIDEEQTDETEYLGVRYTELIPVLVKAIQELKAQNDDLQSQINELKAQ